MSISAAQYAAARRSSAARSMAEGRQKKIHVTSTLRDRTPVAQEKPLDEGQVVWGEPSDFAWGSRSDVTENGPFTNTSWNLSWPPYDFGDEEGDPGDPPDEKPNLTPVVYEWKEVSRVERTVRVTGSNGAWVDVKRMTEVLLAVPKAADGRDAFVHITFAKG